MSSAEDGTEPIHVLHVDDEPGFCELVELFLERELDAIDVVTAASAEAGLEWLDATDEPVDCVVSDYDMPTMNGLELLERVRESNPDLPFVLFTGRGSEEIASEAITAGVSEYVEKQHGTEQYTLLANRIDNLVAGYRAERELEATNERLRKLYAGITDAIFALDTERRFTHVNERAEELLGQSEEELLGELVEEEFSVLAGTKFETESIRAYREDEPVEFEEYYPPRDAWHRVRAVPTGDGLTVHVSDVTERRTREQPVQRQR
ncbi:response regulator [Halococcus hamelinensis]|uniref:HTR-like protein n=1 Tax=Halococcus hamelinensis 100A6 TaxID=1132509 RepID=M0LST5_9EURY|nr:response regulator [Halococcus hamelinensis]EMA36612.1 HTR-like protein [Halococcus hamelinensis 100A6]